MIPRSILTLCIFFVIVDGLMEGDNMVLTNKGRVQGIKEKTLKGKSFVSFYGIPYARPPLGDFRFKAPVESTHWHRIRSANKHPPACLQVGIPFANIMSKERATLDQVIGSENCLFLNVFTPSIKSTSKLPVMVMFHGGGFVCGSNRQYYPHSLLDHDVILVTVQYRLGVLGFLSTEDSVMPGNLGLKDQHLALQWVQKNIVNFGGDKERVTIYGDSAGAMSTHLHILSPYSKGLFSGAILQSGTVLRYQLSTKNRRNHAENVASAVNCPSGDSNTLLSCLQKADAKNLTLQVQNSFKWLHSPMTWIPRVDGDFLPDEPAKLIKNGNYNHVNLMSGVAKDELSINVLMMETQPELRKTLEDNFYEIGPISLEVWQENNPVKIADALYRYYLGGLYFDQKMDNQLVKLYSDIHMNIGHDLVTYFNAKDIQDKKTYRYEFAHQGPNSYVNLSKTKIENDWVSHSDELTYLYPSTFSEDTPLQPPTKFENKDDEKLRDIMTKLWTNFAATGNPTPDDSLGFIWEPTSADNLSFLSITPNPTMKRDNRKKVREYHTSLPLYRYRILFPEHFKNHDEASHTLEDEL